MATPASFSEQECLNIYWKIKNFDFCCEKIASPKYTISGTQYWLVLHRGPVDVECQIMGFKSNNQTNPIREISFLTCDGSPSESISGGRGVFLRVPKDVVFKKRRDSFLPEDTLTVRLRYPTDCERGNLVICSQIGVTRKCFLWRFKYHDDAPFSSEKSAKKSKLYGNVDLKLNSGGGFDSDELFDVEISRTGGERCHCVLKISLLDVGGKALKTVSAEFVFEKMDDQQTGSFPSIIKKSKWIECKNLLLSDDMISLKCDLFMSRGKVADESSDIRYCESAPPLLEESTDLLRGFKEKTDSRPVMDLQVDLEHILENGTLSDVSLHIGSEVIKVHKSILGARSAVFRAMFTKDMREAISHTVFIEDLCVDTVCGLLLYIYTDTIHANEWENVIKLYYAADKYEVLGLKKKCVSFLKTNLSVSNACEALVLADLHRDEDLKTAAQDFISEHDSVVFASKAWKELEKNNSPLVIEVMRKICYDNRLRHN